MFNTCFWGIFRQELAVVNEIVLQYTKTLLHQNPFFLTENIPPRSRESRIFIFLLLFNIEVSILQCWFFWRQVACVPAFLNWRHDGNKTSKWRYQMHVHVIFNAKKKVPFLCWLKPEGSIRNIVSERIRYLGMFCLSLTEFAKHHVLNIMNWTVGLGLSFIFLWFFMNVCIFIHLHFYCLRPHGHSGNRVCARRVVKESARSIMHTP